MRLVCVTIGSLIVVVNCKTSCPHGSEKLAIPGVEAYNPDDDTTPVVFEPTADISDTNIVDISSSDPGTKMLKVSSEDNVDFSAISFGTSSTRVLSFDVGDITGMPSDIEALIFTMSAILYNYTSSNGENRVLATFTPSADYDYTWFLEDLIFTVYVFVAFEDFSKIADKNPGLPLILFAAPDAKVTELKCLDPKPTTQKTITTTTSNPSSTGTDGYGEKVSPDPKDVSDEKESFSTILWILLLVILPLIAILILVIILVVCCRHRLPCSKKRKKEDEKKKIDEKEETETNTKVECELVNNDAEQFCEGTCQSQTKIDEESNTAETATIADKSAFYSCLDFQEIPSLIITRGVHRVKSSEII